MQLFPTLKKQDAELAMLGGRCIGDQSASIIPALQFAITSCYKDESVPHDFQLPISCSALDAKPYLTDSRKYIKLIS